MKISNLNNNLSTLLINLYKLIFLFLTPIHDLLLQLVLLILLERREISELVESDFSISDFPFLINNLYRLLVDYNAFAKILAQKTDWSFESYRTPFIRYGYFGNTKKFIFCICV